ncbi:MAG TPA: ATP-binding protein [Thermoplasmata archaeon]|nr:ATP-binding protein [Thermoplasmata archaeon]
MDPVTNPFSPGAGAPPPELVGRQEILERARVLLARVIQGRSAKSILMTGLRGVGKTVLLNEIKALAAESGYRTILVETPEQSGLLPHLIPQVRGLLLELDQGTGVSARVRRALGVLKSFASAVRVGYAGFEISLDFEAQAGVADSGDLEHDLADLFVALAEAAKDRGTGVALLIDELQYISELELRALTMAMHKLAQEQLPLVLVGAGLPTLPGLAGRARSYAERLFDFPTIGALTQDEAGRAIIAPMASAQVRIDPAALAEIFAQTQGYPYFLQEWAYQTWNRAAGSPVTLDAVREATPIITARLDEGFFRVRFDRLTRSERRYLRAMAEVPPDQRTTGKVAEILGFKVTSMGPTRGNLISKGMVYSPEHGRLDFTVPLFDKFMRRTIPNL